MLKKIFLGLTVASISLGAVVQTAGAAERYLTPAFHQESSEPETYTPISGMSYAVGRNGFVGYFQQNGGKCALTLMLFKRMASEEETPDTSASRVQVSIAPGENARIGSAEGELLELRCNGNAETVTVARFHQNIPTY
jgi:hypothetical protein